MNVLHHFEAVFVVALGVALSASTLMVAPGQSGAAPPHALSANVATGSKMAVVTVAGKRMSAAEKQRALEDERQLAKHGSAAGRRI